MNKQVTSFLLVMILVFTGVFPSFSFAAEQTDKEKFETINLVNEEGGDVPESSRRYYQKNEQYQTKSNTSVEVEDVDRRQIIVKTPQPDSFQAEDFQVEVVNISESLKKQGYVLVSVPETVSFDKVLQQIRESNLVEEAEPDYIRDASYIPEDASYHEQWYLEQINIEKAWDVNRGSADVTVAVIDTGVNVNHPDLKGRVLNGYDFVNKDYDATDDNGHGTLVSGLIAANSDQTGMSGMDHHVKILPIKVMNEEGEGSLFDIINGIYYAINNDADIINMSFGSYQRSVLEEEALWQAHEKGIVLVGAAGNEKTDDWSYPAAYTPVIGVAATGKDSLITDFSNFGSWVDVAAPGIGMYSTDQLGGYQSFDGTSFSTPLVSGLVSLIKAENPDWSPSQIEWALESGSQTENGVEWNEQVGYGQIDAYRAITASLPGLLEDNANVRDQAEILTIGEVASERIDLPMDTDWFRFEIKQETTVTIDLADVPSHLDLITVLYKYEGDTAVMEEVIDNGDEGENETYSFEADRGEYYIEVYDYYNHWSKDAYTLKVDVGEDYAPIEEPESTYPSGAYNKAIDVSLTSSDENASIMYTIDGSTPSVTEGVLYKYPIDVREDMVVKAIAFTDANISDVATFDYQVTNNFTGFPDVKGRWAEFEINYLAERKLIGGYPDGQFGFSDNINRAEAATIIVRELDLPLVSGDFNDVSKDHWASVYIGAAAKANIITGYDSGNYQPEKPLTRSEMAAILARAYELKGTSSVAFSDVDVTNWSYEYIEKLVANNITKGFPDQTFRPNTNIKRSEFAVMVARVMNDSFKEVVQKVD